MISRILPLLGLIILCWVACKDEPGKKAPGAPQIDPELAKLNNLVDDDPENDSLLYRRAEVFYKLEAYDEAIKDLNDAIQLDSLQPAYYHLLADVFLDYARPNDSKRAIDVLLTAAHRFPGRIPTLLKLSEFQLIVRQHSEALETLDKILQRDPQNAEAFFMAGRVALDKGDTLRAITSLQKSVRFDAGNEDAWMFLGRIFANRKNPLAIQYFDNVLRLDSSSLEAREFKGVYYKTAGDFDKAFEVYRDIIVRNPDYSNAYFDMGMMYLEQDSLSKAYDNFNIAIKTDPLFVKAYYYRGHCAELQGNVDAALSDYRQANGMSPDYKEPKEALERLQAGKKPQ
ncbi:MAG: tetratricopeptide repeat protein [Saprospiraceae bacterium]|nr:tetratricopeptide repeat protein [Saprospiraceae bacterium]MCB9306533.1 tetratricopeptide repeat protein [Lewinellaceae bacterium]MCB9355516.1 tetratricopeptide repeat protein [Lewinellaceae bacterium]